MIGVLPVKSVMNVMIPMRSVLIVTDVTMSSMIVITAAIVADAPNVWNTAANVIGVWTAVSMKDHTAWNAETALLMQAISVRNAASVTIASVNGVTSAECVRTAPRRITVQIVMHAEVMCGFV